MRLIDYQMGRDRKRAPLTRHQKRLLTLELVSSALLFVAMGGMLFMFAIMFEGIPQ